MSTSLQLLKPDKTQNGNELYEHLKSKTHTNWFRKKWKLGC